MATENEVAVTSAFLSLALAIHHAKHVYISESQMAEELGLEKPADWFTRCDTLFTKTYAAQADAIGLKRNRQTLEALVYLQIPEECLTTEADKLPTLFAFDPWLGMGRGGIKCLPQPLWHVKLKLEDGAEFTWQGTADDSSHAEGQAIAEATAETGQQIFDVLSVVGP